MNDKPAFVLMLCGILALYIPAMIWLVNSWYTNPFYSHGFLIPVISAFIAWNRLTRGEHSHGTHIYKPGFYVLSAGLALLVLAHVEEIPSLGAFSFIITLSGLIMYLYGRKVMENLIFPIAYLIFAIPPPGILLDQIAYWMQNLSTISATAIVTQLGIPVERVGTEIHMRNVALVVGLPCSGMNSMIALLSLSTLLVYLLRCSFYKKAALVVTSIAFALLANILRITSLLLIGNSYGVAAATGFFHTLFSPLLFIIAFLLLILFSIIIGCRVNR